MRCGGLAWTQDPPKRSDSPNSPNPLLSLSPPPPPPLEPGSSVGNRFIVHRLGGAYVGLGNLRR
eukprot:scaffold23148_cov130-Isochrysis_galbana.AAC.1